MRNVIEVHGIARTRVVHTITFPARREPRAFHRKLEDVAVSAFHLIAMQYVYTTSVSASHGIVIQAADITAGALRDAFGNPFRLDYSPLAPVLDALIDVNGNVFRLDESPLA